jgi:signal transduction histidine kinase
VGGLAPLLARFAYAAHRLDAGRELAARLGVDEVLLLVRDPELGVLVPAPGFAQTLAGGPQWRAFLRSCATSGVHTGDVDYGAPVRPMRATAHVSSDGTALLLFGGTPDAVEVTAVLELLPLLGAAFRAEHAANLARGEAQVARTASGNAKNLALALDAARGEVERALAESARLNAELQDTDRRKDDFMAMLGHELRNPMAAISGAIEVMRIRPNDAAHVERARAIIERQTEQLARLVDDLLDVARITRGKVALRLENLAVAEIARRSLEVVQGLALQKGHEVRLDVRAEVHASADRTRLEQMISNLLTNAAKYTDPGGHITVVVDRDGNDVVVAIQDDGIGIAPAMLPRIFDAFLQVEPSFDRSAGGLGVGLTVVSRLAALHAGRVTAESVLGKGSTFTLRLPIVDPPAAEVQPVASPAAAGRASGQRLRVLVVDDNVDSAEMMVAVAESWGHEASYASDGHSAVTKARELRPDVVLLDIGLPGMDGYEVAARLRDDPITHGARIIAVSGYGLEADRRKSHAAGCDEHLVKPVDMASLARVLGR